MGVYLWAALWRLRHLGRTSGRRAADRLVPLDARQQQFDNFERAAVREQVAVWAVSLGCVVLLVAVLAAPVAAVAAVIRQVTS